MFEYLRQKLDATPHIAVVYDMDDDKSLNIEMSRVKDGEDKYIIFKSPYFSFSMTTRDIEIMLKKHNYTVFDKDIKPF